MIFDFVPPVLIGLFVVVTLAAALIHNISGNHQKVTWTFVVMVGLTAWFVDGPFAEPFPGAATMIVVIATILQAVFAVLAFLARSKNPAN